MINSKHFSLASFMILFSGSLLFAQNERQFDFWIGEWQVNNLFHEQDNSWQDEGKGLLKVWPVLDGKAIIEFWDGTVRDNKITKGFSIRYFDKEKEKWIVCLNWPQANNGGFFLMQGGFRLNRCEIFNQYSDPGNNLIINRYTFSDITDSTYRWNDGRSLDSGRTWQSNWIMENHRIKEIPDWPDINEKFHSYDDDSFSTSEASKRFFVMAGSWQGSMIDSSASGIIESETVLNCWKTQNGISMFYEIETTNNFKEVGMLTYRGLNNMWLSMRLDNQPSSGIITQYWKNSQDRIQFTEYSPLFPKPTTEISRMLFDDNSNMSIERRVSYDESGKILLKQKFVLKKDKI